MKYQHLDATQTQLTRGYARHAWHHRGHHSTHGHHATGGKQTNKELFKICYNYSAIKVIYRPDQEMLSSLKTLQMGLILKQSKVLPWWHSWRHAMHHWRNTRHHWRHSCKVKRHVLQTNQPYSYLLYQTGNTTQEKSLLRNCAYKVCKSPYFNLTILGELTPHVFS